MTASLAVRPPPIPTPAASLEVDIATGAQRVLYTAGNYLGWIAVE